MSKFDITEYPKSESFKKIAYFKSSVGNRTVRIITKGYYKTYAHYTHQTYVECLGKDECPICKRNMMIRAENPKDFREKGFIPAIQRFAVNVYERTPAIICTNCQEENFAGLNNRFNQACSKCGNLIVGVKPQPLNKVKLLSGGVELFSMLNGYDDSQLDAEGNPIGIDNFDINLMGMQAGERIKVTPIPLPHQNDQLDIPDEELFDTHYSVMKLTADEIKQLETGIKVRDLLLARKAQTTDIKVEEGETKATAEELVKDLFNS
jgi:hypothetical protein